MLGNIILIGMLIAAIVAAIIGARNFNKDMSVPCRWGCE